MEEIKKRGAAVKGWLKRDVNNIEDLVNKENVSKIEVINALKDLEKRLEKLDLIQSELEPLLEHSALDTDIDQEYQFYSFCQKARVNAETFLTKLNSDAIATPQSSDSVRSVKLDKGRVQLPKIQMNKFSGEPTEWFLLIDKFDALNGSCDISPVTNFSYLQSLLIGNASACIEKLSLTADNYKHALHILQEHYGRKGKIIFCHIQKLLSVQVVNSRNVQHLWTLHNQLQSQIRSLENLGISKTQYGVILTPLILSRLPAELQLEWARDSNQCESDLDYLMEFLHREIVRRERSQDFSVSLVSEKRQTVSLDVHSVLRKGNYEARKQTTASALLTNESVTKGIPRCVFCDKKHYSSKCNKVSQMDPEVVKCKLRENKLCYVCFRPYNYHHHCKVKCSFCHRKPNAIFCNQKRENQSPPDSNPNTNAMIYAKSEFMHLSKWASKSSVVKEKLGKNFSDANVQGEVVKVLGLIWNSAGDHFGFKGGNSTTEVVVTNRLVLSMLSRIFDPLGFLTPFTMEAKVIFQELRKAGKDWDEEVTGDLKIRFIQSICGLSLLQQWAVPRCYVTYSWLKRKSTELLCFCDASEKGYCVTVYLRVAEEDDSQTTSLVISKARVAPLKRMTLPRLELMGCLLGARM